MCIFIIFCSERGTVFELDLLFNGTIPVDNLLMIEKEGTKVPFDVMGREFYINDVEFGSGNVKFAM